MTLSIKIGQDRDLRPYQHAIQHRIRRDKQSEAHFKPPQAIMSTVDRVLNTPELVEHIILQDLPIYDVFMCRRICHFFKGAIDGSKPVRRVLFLEPETIQETFTADYPTHREVLSVAKIHSLLKSHVTVDEEQFKIPALVLNSQTREQ